MFIAAAVALVLAVGLFAAAFFQAGKASLIAGTPTSTVAELAETAGKAAADSGAGSLARYVELKGKAAAEPPMRADFSGTECVYYECVVTREYEEEYYETDKDGLRQRRARRGSEQVSRIVRDPVFLLDDGSGRIAVDPAGAAVEPASTLSRFEPGDGGPSLSVGNWHLPLPVLGHGRRTLGFRFEERSLPVGQPLYALGEVSVSGGTLALRKPVAKGQRFIISVKSEEILVAGARTATLWLRIGAGAAAAAAAGLAVAGFLRL